LVLILTEQINVRNIGSIKKDWSFNQNMFHLQRYY